jgi:hypothetical protein
MFLWHNGMQAALSGWAFFLRHSLHKMQNKTHVFEMAQTPIWRFAKSECKRQFLKVNPRFFQPTVAMGSTETIDHVPPHLCGTLGERSFFLRGSAK